MSLARGNYCCSSATFTRKLLLPVRVCRVDVAWKPPVGDEACPRGLGGRGALDEYGLRFLPKGKNT